MSAVTTPDAADRALRADAKRNRDALLESAGQAFAEHGTAASLEDVARRAGVGIGTLYRHFPTRDALVEAAYRHGVEQLCDSADQLLATLAPDVALVMALFMPAIDMGRELIADEAPRLLFEQDQVLGHPGRARQIDGIHGDAWPIGSRESTIYPQR